MRQLETRELDCVSGGHWLEAYDPLKPINEMTSMERYAMLGWVMMLKEGQTANTNGDGSEGAASDTIVVRANITGHTDGWVPWSTADGDYFDEAAIIASAAAFALFPFFPPASAGLGFLAGFLFIMDQNPDWGRQTG